jgi:hypothetical protein
MSTRAWQTVADRRTHRRLLRHIVHARFPANEGALSRFGISRLSSRFAPERGCEGCRIHTSDRRSEASLAAETGLSRDEEGRLQPRLAATIGCPTKQADLPIGRRFANPPHKVLQNRRPRRGCPESVNAARMSACAPPDDPRLSCGLDGGVFVVHWK